MLNILINTIIIITIIYTFIFTIWTVIDTRRKHSIKDFNKSRKTRLKEAQKRYNNNTRL
jgi:uncharacterized membrane protein (DUF106 family)